MLLNFPFLFFSNFDPSRIVATESHCEKYSVSGVSGKFIAYRKKFLTRPSRDFTICGIKL